MDPSHAAAEGRAALERGAWRQSFTIFTAEDGRAPLAPEDLDRLAIAAYLIGEDAVSVDARSRAHAAFLERGDHLAAARSAFWLAFSLFDKPRQRSQAAGWLARAQRLVDEAQTPCVEEGWLTCSAGYQRVTGGDPAAAFAFFEKAAAIGAQFGNVDLMTFARHGQGRCLLMMRQTTEGFALLDEVMIAVTGGEVAPIVTGVVYCSVISACHDFFDLRRAQEWTTTLQAWTNAHPDLVPFRGACLVHRAEVLQRQGAWREALDEAQRGCDRFEASPDMPDAGTAHYQVGELHRLRGDFDKADESYRLASQRGRQPYPGLAYLRLAQGRPDAADAAIRPALRETTRRSTRVHLLRAAIEIAVATGDVASARAWCDELASIATGLDATFLHAAAADANGLVTLAEGRADAALAPLRDAAEAWRELDAPYQLARVRVALGCAYRQLGDLDGAMLELEAAQDAFEQLGAAPDAARVAALSTPAKPAASGGLTGREVEVLRLVATGATNKAIAAQLSISEKTVARHLDNIFTKLDLSSRAAATAYAFRHRLV